MAIEQVTDHAARALARLAAEFKGAARLQALITALAEQGQELESLFVDLITLRSIDNGEGAQLDQIGAIIGQPRAGASDAAYKYALRGRIRARRSSGTVEHVLATFRALEPNATLEMESGGEGTASYTIRIGDVALSADAAEIAVDLLHAATSGGVRGLVEWQQATDDNMFMFPLFVKLSGSHSAGVSVLTVTGDLSDWPAAGTVIVDQGTALEETLSYVSRTSSTLSGNFFTTHIHANNTEVVLVESEGKALGGDANLCGELAGAGD